MMATTIIISTSVKRRFAERFSFHVFTFFLKHGVNKAASGLL